MTLTLVMARPRGLVCMPLLMVTAWRAGMYDPYIGNGHSLEGWYV